MATASRMTGATAPLMVRVHDGSRQLMPEGKRLLYRLFDGNNKEQFSDFVDKPVLRAEVPFFDNLGDNYRVVVSGDNLLSAGFAPAKVRPGAVTFVDLMLLPKNSEFSFARARWTSLEQTHPHLVSVLTGSLDAATARQRYEELMEDEPGSLACFLNVVTAMADIRLRTGTALSRLKQLRDDHPKDSMAGDRLFAFAEASLIDEVEEAAEQGLFKREPLPGAFHPGATRSYKEVRFGEANVQLTFHEGTRKNIGGQDCVLVEPDMDYFQDTLSHALLEVLPNRFGGETDPRQIYVLRWIAGRRAGVTEFEPPYEIREA